MDCRYSSTRRGAGFCRNAFRHFTGGLALFLTVLLVGLSLPAQAQPVIVGTDAKVYWGFEQRQISAEDATKIVGKTVGGYDSKNRWGDGYIGLWIYAYLDIDHFRQFVGKYSSGRNKWDMNYSGNTTWKIERQDGTVDKTGDIALTLPFAQQDWEAGTTEFWGHVTGFRPGIGYAQTATTTGQGMTNPFDYGLDAVDKAIDTFEIAGKKYFRVKLFQVRFQWKQAKSFYVSLYSDGKDYGDDASNGSSEMALLNSQGDFVLPCSGADFDWAKSSGVSGAAKPSDMCGGVPHDFFDFRQGGVEIIAGFKGELAGPGKTLCPNEEAVNTLKIKRYNPSNASWDQTKFEVEFHNPTTNAWGNRLSVVKDPASASATQPSILYKSGSKTAPTEAAPTTAELTIPASVHRAFYDRVRLLVHAPKPSSTDPVADFLLGVDTVYTFEAALEYYPGSKLSAAFIDGITQWKDASGMYGKKLGRNGDKDTIVGIVEGSTVCAVPADQYPNSPLDQKLDLKSGDDWSVKDVAFGTALNGEPSEIIGVELFYASSLLVPFTSAAKATGSDPERTANFTLNDSGYYYISYKNKDNSCVFYTDTVYVKVTKPLLAPTLTLKTGADCSADGAGVQAYTAQNALEWEWAISNYFYDANNNWATIDNPTKPEDGLLCITVKVPIGTVTVPSALKNVSGWGHGYEDLTYVMHGGSHESDFSLLNAIATVYTKPFYCGGLDFLLEGQYKDYNIGVYWPKEGNGVTWSSYASSTDYKFIEGTNKANIMARYKDAATGEWSPWAKLQPDCSGMGAPRRPVGISATACWSSGLNPTSYWGTLSQCKETDESANPGETKVLRCYFDNQATGSIAGYALSLAKITIYWQSRAKSTDPWVTWGVTGYNTPHDETIKSYTDLPSEFKGDWHYTVDYVESPPRVITKTEEYRVLVFFDGCPNKVPSYLGDMSPDGAFKDYYLGLYDSIVTITCGASAGKAVVSKETPENFGESTTICYGDNVKLKLEGVTSAETEAVWYDSIPTGQAGAHGWRVASYIGVNGRALISATNTVTPAIPDNDALYNGSKIYYRAVIGSGEGQLITKEALVTAYKACKVYANYKNAAGVRKSSDAGYCLNEKITLYATATKNSTTKLSSVPACAGTLKYEVFADGSFWDAGASGTEYTYTSDKNYVGLFAYRITTTNQGCMNYSDTIYIRTNPEVKITSLTPATKTVCEGEEVELTANTPTPNNCNRYLWQFYNSDGTLKDSLTAQSTLRYKFPYTTTKTGNVYDDYVFVTGIGVFGNTATNDTTVCYENIAAWSRYATITSNPKPVITAGLKATPATLCVGDAAATIKIDGKSVVSGTSGGTYFYKDWKKDGVALSGASTSDTYTTGNPVAKSDSGSYTVRVYYKDPAGCTSDTIETAGVTLDVKSLPTMPTITMGNDTSFCIGGSGTLKAKVEPAINTSDPNYTYYTYWYETTSATVPASDPASAVAETQELTLSGSKLDKTRYYYFVVWKVDKNTNCTNVVRASKAVKVDVRECKGAEIAGTGGCPDADPTAVTVTFGSRVPSKIEWYTTTTAPGDGTVAESAWTLVLTHKTPSGSNSQYTPDNQPTQTTYIRAIVSYSDGTQDDPLYATYTIYELPTGTFTWKMNNEKRKSLEVCEGDPLVCISFTFSSTLSSTNTAWTWEHNGNVYTPQDRDEGICGWLDAQGGRKDCFCKVPLDSAGYYKVSTVLTSSSQYGGCKNTVKDSVNLTIKPKPAKPGIPAVSDTSFCSNTAYRFTIPVDSIDGATYNYKWEASQTGTSAYTQVNGATTTTIKLCKRGAGCTNGVSLANGNDMGLRLVVTSTKDGCSRTDTAKVNIKVNDAPSVDATVDNGTICAGASHTFEPTGLAPDPSANSTYKYEYRWSAASGSTAGTVGGTDNKDYTVATDADATAQKINNYTFVYKVTTDKGCFDSVIKNPKLTVNARTKVSITKDITDQEICEGASTSFVATASGASKYEWYKASTATGPWTKQSASTATLSFSAAATTDAGFYKLLAFSTSGCPDSAWSSVKELTVHPKAIKPVIADMAEVKLCQGETGHTLTATVTSAAQSPGESTQKWYLTNTTSAAVGSGTSYGLPATTYNTAGTYTYIYKQVNITDKNCKDSAQQSVTVKVNATPTVSSVSITGDDDYCTHNNKTANSMTLTANASPAAGSGVTVKYQWFKDAGATPVQDAASNTYTKTAATTDAGSYTVKAIYTLDGCADTATSDAKAVAVTQTPTIAGAAITPATENICAGDSFEFAASATITGATSTTYQWKKGSGNLSGSTTDKYGKTSGTNKADDEGGYSVVITAVKTTDKGKECKAWEEPTATLTVTDLPDLGSVTIASDATDDKACTELTLTATAKNAAGTAISSGVTYQWQKYNGTDWENVGTASSTKTYKVTTIGDNQKYRCVASMGVSGSTCGKSVTSAEKTVTVLTQPAITSVTVSQPDPLCVGSDVTLTATVSPATPNAGTYTYAWKKGTTALSGTTASLALTNLATSDAGSYTCTVTATNDICTADKSGSTTLTVVDTIRFTGTKITDSRNGDTCMKTGNFTLTVAGAPTGKGNLSYAWTLPGGSTAVSPGDNKTLTVPHALVNSGKYKVKVTLAPTTANPCGNDTTLEIDVKIVMCGNEPLKPGTAGQQNNDIALVCEKGNENTTIEVTFEPTAEKAAVTEVKWMKYASAPDANSTAEGTPIKTVAVDASTSWPLHLNHSEVFDGSETLPAQYYVRAKVTRTGNVVNFTDNYRFVKVKNAPKVEPTMKPADTTVCINETVIFAVGGTKPADPANPFSLNTATSEDLKYFWKKPDVSSFSLGNSSMTAVTSNVVTGAEYQAYIVSGYKYQVNGTRSATNTCYDTSSTIATGKLTVKAKPTFTSVVDADGNTSSTICANATAYPELTATYTNAETVQWEHTAGGITNILSAAADKNKYQLLDADVTKPAAGAADIANVYKVTVGNGVCASVSKTYTLTVMSMPNLTDVLINGKIPAPEFEFCGDGILTAQPKSGNADYSGTPAPTYKWQTSSATGADDSWTDVTPNGTSKTRNLTAPDNNYYRCIVTATKTAGACPVSDTSTAVQVTVSAGSSKGTATIDKTAICNSENAVFNVTGQTGDITKIEISNSNSFPAGTNTVEITSGISLPYTIDPKSTTPNIAGLLTSRKTTLYVRATVRSGGVCTAVTTDVKSVDVYKPHDGIGYTLPDGVLCAATNVTYTPAINSEYEEIVWTIKTASGTTRTSTSTASTGYINTVGLEPKWNQDTSYTLEAVVNNTKVDGGCDGINATPKTFKVGRKAVAPVVSAGLTLCEGSDYEVWANRPAEAELTWSLTKDGTAAACGTPGVSGQKETVSVTDAAPGAYIYTAKDATACDNKTSTINVTVKEKAVAKTITLSGNGSSYCSANDITITASDYKPTTGATIQWQVSTDTTDATSTVNKGTGATLSKPGGLTAGTQYFVRYVVKGDAPCGDSASKWVPFKIFESPQISGASVTDKICEGSDITIAFTAEKGYTYTVYSNGSNATTGGTQVATGTVPDGGSVSLTTSAVYGKGHFYVVVTDPDGNGVTCATKTQYLGVTDIDRKVTAGDLTITAPQSGDVINAKVGQTVTLQITGTTPAGAFTEQIMWVSAKVGATPDYASASALGGTTQQLTSSHQDTTYYWTKVTSRLGLCDAAYSDTVKVYVELGNKPTLEVKSPICQSSSDVELTVSNIQDSWKNEFKWDQIQWQYRVKGASAWTDITSGMGTINQSTGKVTYTPSPALSAGEYEFQYKYKIGENDAVWIEDPATLRVDALSVGGKLASTDDTVCQNGTRPVLSLSGHTGTITGTYFGTTDFPANPTQVSTGTDATNLYQVPTANQSGSGYYRVMVKSGVCPEAYSDTIEVRVIQTPVAGTLSQQTLCFDNDTKEVVYSGGTGSNLIWQQASTENGPYADITPTATNKYEVGPLTDHIWVKVIVNTHSVCAADTVKREVKVYDTLKIKTQPDDVTVTGTGKSATFTVAAETAGLKYADASNTLEPVTPKTYTWEYSEDGGTTWGSLPGTNHTASNGTLTVSNAELYEGKLYRCTITSNPCDRSVVSKAVTIKANAKLVPGETKSRTECDCYYPTDSVIYFVQGAAGEGKLTYRWQISTMDNPDAANAAHWTNLEAVSGLTGKYTVDTNRIVFLQMQNLDEAHAKWIRAWVKDEASPEEPTTGNLVKICRQPKPTYTFEGNIVCERTSGTAELLFKYTANPNHIDGRSIKYAYALPSDPTNFTEINIPNGSNTNTSVSLPNSKSLTFTVKAADTSLVIPASSAIPFEADSMIIRMEVRSCYTPDPDQNTDTTMYVLLRVDAPVRITRRAPDTIMCVGTSFDMETGFAMRNKTIPDNEVTAKWYSPTQFHEKTAKFYTTQEGTAVLDFKNLTEDDAGIWYVDLSTEYCPAVTDSITVGVHKVPAFNGDITPAEVCKGITATLTATIDATATTDYTLQWQRKNGTSWEDVTDGTEDGATYSGATTTTLSITNTDVAQAGEYRLNLVVTLASCEGTLSKESSVTVRLVPEVTLNPHYKVQLQEGGNRDVKVTWNTPTQPFVTVAEPTGYEWRAQAPEANSFSKMTGSEPFVEGNVQDQQTIKIVAPGKAYDSTLFYAKVTTGCGTVETKWDTLRIFEGFAISNVTPTVGDGQTDPIIPPACEGEDVDIVVETNAPATYVEWHVSTNGGTTWTALSPLPDARYDSAWEDGVYTLTIHNVTTGMEGWMYRVKVHDAEMTWDSSDKWVVKLHIDKPVKFTCPKGVFEESAGKEPAVVIGGSPENSVFSFKVLCASTACPYTDHACDLTYAYERSKPALGVTQRDDYSLEDSASTYTFTPPATDTGLNLIRFIASNHCGGDTVYDSVMVINVINPGPITAIERLPEPDPELPDDIKQEVVDSNPIDFTVCDSNYVWFAASFTPKTTYPTHWEISGDGNSWNPIALGGAYSVNGDSLIIKPVSIAADMDGKMFRRVLELPGKIAPVYSHAFTLHITPLPDKSPFSLTIRDADDDAMQDGDVREAHQVVFNIYDTVSGVSADGYTKLCVMRYVNKDSVEEVICQEAPFSFPLQIPSFTAEVEKHDSTLYFIQAYNDCGKVLSDLRLLRVYDTLIVRWVADTIIYTDKGDDWSVDSLDEIVPGRLIDVYSALDSTPMQAHVFLCDSTYAHFADTTLKGFMNPLSWSGSATKNSRWWMKLPNDEEWRYASTALWAQFGFEHQATIEPYYGMFTLEDDGLQIKGWGVNNLYCDSTSVLTIHMLPGLDEGDLSMTPAEVSLCESAPGNDQTFEISSRRYEGELWEMAAAAYNFKWQYSTPESEAWIDVDSLDGRALWHFGAVKAEHDGWKIRAFASVPCGTDTVEAVIRVTPSLTPVVRLVSDSACLGDTLTFTASTENMGENPVFEWFVDGVKVEGANGAQYKVAGLAAGEHKIEVRATLTDATLCVSPDNASAEEVAVVYDLPRIEAFIADTLMKNTDTTSVWVKGQGDYTYAWTPETGLLEPTADSTLLWGLEPQQEPHVYVVTATDENGCQAQDSVWVRIESNFTIDSFSIVVVVPPVLDLDGGRLPGYPEEPEDSYYPELGGTPFGGELMFRDDTVADLWICAHNTALIHFNVRGGEKPITYKWRIEDGNAKPVYPVDVKEDEYYSFTEPDSVFGIFFPDTSTHTMRCEIRDLTGAGGAITIYVHYYKPEMFYLEVTPKVTSGKYYEQQAMNFFVRPDRDWLTTWVDVRNGKMVDTVTNRKMNRQMSFTKEEGDETSIWISTVDRHGCRIWDSVPIHIIPLPNVLLVGDPINGVIFPEFEVEITNTWGLKVKGFEDRNGNGSSRGWDGRTKSGTYVAAGTYYYRAKIPTLDKKGYMIVNGAVTVVNK